MTKHNSGTRIFILFFWFWSIRNQNFNFLFRFWLNWNRKLDYTRFWPKLTRIDFPKKNILFKRCSLRLNMHFKRTCYILKIFLTFRYRYRKFIHHILFLFTGTRILDSHSGSKLTGTRWLGGWLERVSKRQDPGI